MCGSVDGQFKMNSNKLIKKIEMLSPQITHADKIQTDPEVYV
jgi:hypothetical protein